MGEQSQRKRDRRLCYLCCLPFTPERPSTKDHVVPRRWLPEPLPDNLPTVLAHFDCQNALSSSEERLRNLFVKAEGTEQDVFADLLSRTERGRPVEVKEHVLLGDAFGRFLSAPVGALPDDDIQCVFAKITRGLFFKKFRQLLPASYPIKATAATAEDASHITRVLAGDYQAPVNHVGEALAWAAITDTQRGKEHGLWFFVPLHATMVVVGTGVCAEAEFNAALGLLLRHT